MLFIEKTIVKGKQKIYYAIKTCVKAQFQMPTRHVATYSDGPRFPRVVLQFVVLPYR